MRHLISLGHNCDVAFQLRMHGAENIPHFFDWLGTPAGALEKVFAADFDVFHAEDLAYFKNNASHYVRDMATGIVFFHQFPYVNGHTTADFMLFYAGFIKNFKFQARRFREYVKTLPVTLVRRNIKEAEAISLENTFFERFPGADVQFLYLVHDRHEFQTAHGHARHLPVTRLNLGDPEVWSKLLAEEGLIGAPYRHSTVEILGASHEDHSLSPEDRFTDRELLAAIAGNPEHPLFLIELARFYRKRSRFADAEIQSLRALALAPDKPEGLYELTLARWRGQKITAAEAAELLIALAKRSQLGDLLTDAATALFDAGKVEEAADYAARAIQQNPLSHRAYYTRALCFHRQFRLVNAERAIAAALRLWSRAPHYHRFHARVLEGMGRTEDAVVALRAAIALGADYSSLAQLGKLHQKQGRLADAIAAWREALPLAGRQQESVQRWIAEAELAAAPALPV